MLKMLHLFHSEAILPGIILPSPDTCPNCKEKVGLEDLDHLLQNEAWEKMASDVEYPRTYTFTRCVKMPCCGKTALVRWDGELHGSAFETGRQEVLRIVGINGEWACEDCLEDATEDAIEAVKSDLPCACWRDEKTRVSANALNDVLVSLDPPRMRRYTHKEWLEEGARLFGPGETNFPNWRFRCPMCGNVQTPAMFVKVRDTKELQNGKAYREINVDGDAYFNCIGRFTKAFGGCDWTLGGLFQIHEVEVTLPDGTVARAFDFYRSTVPRT